MKFRCHGVHSDTDQCHSVLFSLTRCYKEEGVHMQVCNKIDAGYVIMALCLHLSASAETVVQQ
jgi:hypothetical protein